MSSGPILVQGQQSPVFGTDRPSDPTPTQDYVFLGGFDVTADTTPIEFADISQDYCHLVVEWIARGAGVSGIPTQLFISVNGDFAESNYEWIELEADKFTTEYFTGGSNEFSGGLVTNNRGSNDPAMFSHGYARFAYYTNTVAWKPIHAYAETLQGHGTSDPEWAKSDNWGHWQNAAAINSIRLRLAGFGLGDNFMPGSQFTLYGIKGSPLTSVP